MEPSSLARAHVRERPSIFPSFVAASIYPSPQHSTYTQPPPGKVNSIANPLHRSASLGLVQQAIGKSTVKGPEKGPPPKCCASHSHILPIQAACLQPPQSCRWTGTRRRADLTSKATNRGPIASALKALRTASTSSCCGKTSC